MTNERLTRYARVHAVGKATLARELINEALARREAAERERSLARDYSAGRNETRELLGEHLGLQGP